jgi:hypothetical protein
VKRDISRATPLWLIASVYGTVQRYLRRSV